MQDPGYGNPPLQDGIETIPLHLGALTATDQNAPPQPANTTHEDTQLTGITGNGRVQHPVYPSLLDCHAQRIQRLMRATSGPEPVGEAFEVLFVYLIEDGHHGLLNDFVFQCRDTQRPLLSVRLRNLDSSRGLCPIRCSMNPAMQIGDPILHTSFILLPRHAIHSGRRLTLKCVEAIAK